MADQDKFQELRMLCTFLYVIGWITISLVVILTFFGITQGVPIQHTPRILAIIIGLVLGLLGLLVAATGQIGKVFLAIEENTRKTEENTRKQNV